MTLSLLRPLLSQTGLALAALAFFLGARPAAAQYQVFSQGEVTPETISQAPAGFGTAGGNYLVPDANHGTVGGSLWQINAATGATKVFAPEVGVPSSGLFLPATGWGDFSGDFLTFGQDVSSTPTTQNYNGIITAYAADGSASPFASVSGDEFAQSLLAPASFTDGTHDFGGDLLVTDEFNHQLVAVRPDQSAQTISTTVPSDAFGIASAPAGFGALGGQVLVDGAAGGQIVTVAPDGTTTDFTTLSLASGQVGLRQMAFSPSGFLPGYGQLLFVSVSGSKAGGGTAGDVLALDAAGTVVASLRETQGFTKFDPRGLFFTSDDHLLISDASDPIDRLSPSDFQMGPPVPEASTTVSLGLLLALGMGGLVIAARRKKTPVNKKTPVEASAAS